MLAEVAGEFVVPPARVELMYQTEIRGHSGTFRFKVAEQSSAGPLPRWVGRTLQRVSFAACGLAWGSRGRVPRDPHAKPQAAKGSICPPWHGRILIFSRSPKRFFSASTGDSWSNGGSRLSPRSFARKEFHGPPCLLADSGCPRRPDRAEPGVSIPVFRYALEHRAPSQYEVVVFHKGGLPQATRELLDKFADPVRGANLQFVSVDIDAKIDKKYQRLGRARRHDAAVAGVRFPDAGDKSAPLWAGPVAEDTLAALVDSPVRQKMAQCLTHGDAAVFLLLMSGISEADAAAEAMVRGELGRLQDKIKLPEQSRDGPQLLFDIPLKVSFPLVTVSRKSEAERYLVQMLLRGDEDLSRVKGPILFPIFGRGRILSSFHGEDLSADQVGTVARFLCGASAPARSRKRTQA